MKIDQTDCPFPVPSVAAAYWHIKNHWKATGRTPQFARKKYLESLQPPRPPQLPVSTPAPASSQPG